MSYIKSCYVYAKFDEPIKVAQWKLEKLWSFKKARNVLIKKYIYSIRFRSISKVSRSGKEQQKVVNV